MIFSHKVIISSAVYGPTLYLNMFVAKDKEKEYFVSR